MSDTDVQRELATLTKEALRASAENDRAFYDGYLAPDATAVLPVGVMTKSQVLGSMQGERAPFAAKRIEATHIRALGSDAGIVTYRAIYERDGREVSVMATTVCERRDGVWKAVQYQQTPLAPPTSA
ncbi:ketosteroid isomerase-like protein [Caulobacter ginsengisoli]|uniref:Ketosteroid isomerase-like protein n=1 Tax=Caulobacter ginsengisoli TaxID=400775 RepID=A0ABU0IUB9_9CAUL|nr:nuclear transport factor 2 family protein [Caulobacter ginsengisoli]MDQ0465608.1 ketosteroid isomerase-like protein [Caulobacter ginsengisoli]